MDDIAHEISGMDPNWNSAEKIPIHGCVRDAYLKPIAANTNGIFECLEKERSIFTGMRNGSISEPDWRYPAWSWYGAVFL